MPSLYYRLSSSYWCVFVLSQGANFSENIFNSIVNLDIIEKLICVILIVHLAVFDQFIFSTHTHTERERERERERASKREFP